MSWVSMTVIMTTVADVSVPVSVIPPGSALTDTNTRVEFVRHVSVGDGSRHYCRVIESDDLDAFERAVRADPHVADVESVDRTTPRPLYRIEWAVSPPCPALYRPDLLIERMSATPNRWAFGVRVGDPDALRDLQRDCRDAAVHLEVDRLEYSAEDADADPFGLTSKQRAVLVAAAESGFFEVPRETTLVELASGFGTSDQAVSECLRRALRNLVRTTVLADPASNASSARACFQGSR